MPLKDTSEMSYATIGASKKFHGTVRQLAAIEDKKMWEVLDAVALPVLQRRLDKLNGKSAK